MNDKPKIIIELENDLKNAYTKQFNKINFIRKFRKYAKTNQLGENTIFYKFKNQKKYYRLDIEANNYIRISNSVHHFYLNINTTNELLNKIIIHKLY